MFIPDSFALFVDFGTGIAIPVSAGLIQLFCGSGEGFAMGTRQTAKLGRPTGGVCRDPLNANGYFIGDESSIRYFDDAKDEMTLFAGGPVVEESTGTANRLREITAMLITSDGKTIWFGEGRSTIRRLDTTSRQVTTAYGDGVLMACWDHKPSVKPDSVLYCTTYETEGQLCQFNTITNK